MSKQSSFDKIIEIFRIASPSIEQGIDSMQPHDQQKTKQAWQGLASMLEANDIDTAEFTCKLKEFSQQIREQRVRSSKLSSDAKIDVV